MQLKRGDFSIQKPLNQGLVNLNKAKRIYAKVFSGRTVFRKLERVIFCNLWIFFRMSVTLKTVDYFSKLDWLKFFWTKPLKFADRFSKLAGWLKHCERKIENGRLLPQIGKKTGTLRKTGFWFFSLAKGKQFLLEKEGVLKSQKRQEQGLQSATE